MILPEEKAVEEDMEKDSLEARGVRNNQGGRPHRYCTCCNKDGHEARYY